MPLNIESTKNTPRFVFDELAGAFSVDGKCFPENTRKTFQRIFEWIGEWKPQTTELTVNFNVDYISSSSMISFIKFFNLLAQKMPNAVTVFWYYDEDDEESVRTGQNFEEICPIKIKYVIQSV